MASAMSPEAVVRRRGCSRMALVEGERSEGCGQAARKEAKILPTGACAGARRKLLGGGALQSADCTGLPPRKGF